jgi:hypothetical protein
MLDIDAAIHTRESEYRSRMRAAVGRSGWPCSHKSTRALLIYVKECPGHGGGEAGEAERRRGERETFLG